VHRAAALLFFGFGLLAIGSVIVDRAQG